MNRQITKTSRILSVYHLFLNCQEVSFQDLKQQFEVSEKTSLRDIRLLEWVGVPETRYDRACRASPTAPGSGISRGWNSWAVRFGISGDMTMNQDGGITKFPVPTG